MTRLAIIASVLVVLAGAAFSRGNGPAPDAAGTARAAPQTAALTSDARCAARRPSLRVAVGERRTATWRWQTELREPRTRSSYRERTALGCPYLRWIRSTWAQRADERWRLYASLRDPETAICHVFGHYCDEALDVAWCESRLSTRATNGQYLGLFQMGAYERALFGHGETAYEQSLAAHAYFTRSGRDWSPWSCQP